MTDMDEAHRTYYRRKQRCDEARYALTALIDAGDLPREHETIEGLIRELKAESDHVVAVWD